MWLLWDKQFTQAMGSAADFIDRYPEHPGVPQARDIIWTAFQSELGNALAEQNYRRILLLWNGFPLVRERYGELDPKMRYALAQGYMERGDEAKGLELLGAFLTARMDPDYGELALTEYFNRYLKAGAWDKILICPRSSPAGRCGRSCVPSWNTPRRSRPRTWAFPARPSPAGGSWPSARTSRCISAPTPPISWRGTLKSARMWAMPTPITSR